MPLELIFTYDIRYLKFERRLRNLQCGGHCFYGWVSLLSLFLSIFIILHVWLLFYLFVFMFLCVSTYFNLYKFFSKFLLVFHKCQICFPIFCTLTYLIFFLFEMFPQLIYIDSLILSQFSLKLTSSFILALFHSTKKYVLLLDIFCLPSEALCNLKAQVESLDGGITLCTVPAGPTLH